MLVILNYFFSSSHSSQILLLNPFIVVESFYKLIRYLTEFVQMETQEVKCSFSSPGQRGASGLEG